jgi:AmiR/NasT family two-component response regulator
LVTQLNEALTSRSVIDQARGILIARTDCTADDANGHDDAATTAS